VTVVRKVLSAQKPDSPGPNGLDVHDLHRGARRPHDVDREQLLDPDARLADEQQLDRDKHHSPGPNVPGPHTRTPVPTVDNTSRTPDVLRGRLGHRTGAERGDR
jgi:hypothetical protein